MGKFMGLFPVLMLVFISGMVLMWYPGLDLQAADEYLVLLPSLFLIVVSLYGAKQTRDFNRVLAYALVGVGFAMMAGQLDALGVWTPDLLPASLSLQYFQALLVALGVIVGAALK